MQERLFPIAQSGPPGFRYQPEFITRDEEKKLLKSFGNAPLKTYKYKGYESKRRVKSFGKHTPFPLFFRPLLKRVAAYAGVLPSAIKHAMITEYVPGTAIGWHRDRETLKVIGISLGSGCTFRLRKLPNKFDKNSDKRKWEHITITVEPRSIYIMAGESCTRWQHSIAKVPHLRYSLTMRTIEKSIQYRR